MSLNDIERAKLAQICIQLEELSRQINAMVVPYRAELATIRLADRKRGEADHIISVLVDLEVAVDSIDEAANTLDLLELSADNEDTPTHA